MTIVMMKMKKMMDAMMQTAAAETAARIAAAG